MRFPLLSGLAARLFGAEPHEAGAPPDPQLVGSGVEAVVDAVDPRLRTLPGYAQKIAPAVACTIVHLRELASRLPEPIELSRAAWADDAFLNAVFATADDIPLLLARSPALKRCFETHAGAPCAYALLGMVKATEARTKARFSQHQLVCPAPDLAACRREIGVRILGRLAALALQHVAELERTAGELERRKALLHAKLRLLHLRSDGLEQIVQGEGGVAAQISAIERELKATLDDYLETKASAQTLEARLYQIEAVFGAPAEHVRLDRVPLGASGITLHELSLGDGVKPVVALVRCRRDEAALAKAGATARVTQVLI